MEKTLCSTSCPTQDHKSWGECIRSKNLRISQVDVTAQRAWDRELDSYADAVRQGIQPASTRTADIKQAVEISNETGVAFKGA